jgi:hypothetical protein
MIAMREVTVWDCDFQPNHTYLFDGDRVVAYIKKGTTEAIYFKDRGPRLDRRYRKFVEVVPSPFKKMKSNLIKIVGSRGDVYQVDPDKKTCTCNGYKYQGRCRHLAMANVV